MPQIKKGDVVVITGASSGIGRATAREFARRGAHLVLVARNQEKLESVGRECEAFGGTYQLEILDVTDSDGIQRLADEVVRRVGRIDVWVNNAGVGVIGSFTDVPLEDHQRVIQTNVLGYLSGSYAALRIFKQQNRGVLINNASIVSRLAMPVLASYTMSKFAVRGLSHSLRQDLALEKRRHIHVCQVNPAVVDTPAFQHTANYSGAPIKIKIPMVTAEQVARAIVSLVEKPKPEVFVGFLGRLGSFAYTLFPSLTASVLTWGTRRYYLDAEADKKPTSGNLFAPPKDLSSTAGGWKSGQTNKV